MSYTFLLLFCADKVILCRKNIQENFINQKISLNLRCRIEKTRIYPIVNGRCAEKMNMDTLDEIDLKILRQLQQDSHLTTKELAARVSLSSTPVFERVRRLEREGYIRGYVALLDADKLDKGLCVFCNVKLRQHNCGLGREFMKEIQDIPEITECYNISGEFDYMLKIYVRSMKHYQDFVLDVLGKLSSVGSIQSNFVMSEVKRTTAIPI